MSTKKVSSSKSKSTVDATTKNTALPSIPPSPSLLTDYDVHLFREGKHFKLYEKLGAHLYEHEGVKGTLFAVWAPNASYVSVVGDFNQWHAESNPLNPRWDGCGVWEIFVPAVGHGDLYKYIIKNRDTGEILEKFDPFAFFNEVPPKRASIVWDFQYQYKSKPINKETGYDALRKPYSIYEMHYASWKWNTIENRPLSYR
jgi:1,4-alpha-glucan branching enzyme